MSRSNPNTHVANPASKFLEWHGKNANLYYWDKVEKKNLTFPLPFSFIYLDHLSTIKGWNDANNCGIYSNEVRNTTTDPLNVKVYKGGQSFKGLYQDIKAAVKEAGGKFNASIYAMIRNKDTKEWELVNIAFDGSALHAWGEFLKANREAVLTEGIRITGFKALKKGSIDYVVPTFEIQPITQQETRDQAMGMDKELQSYLSAYLVAKPDPTTEGEVFNENFIPDEGYVHHEAAPVDQEDDLPF